MYLTLKNLIIPWEDRRKLLTILIKGYEGVKGYTKVEIQDENVIQNIEGWTLTVASLDELKKTMPNRVFWYWKPLSLLPRKMLKEAGYTKQTNPNESCSYKNSWSMTKDFLFHLKTSLSCLFREPVKARFR